MAVHTYLAEIYTPRRGSEHGRQIAAAADALGVRHLRGVFVPSEETEFHLFAAGSPEDVERVLRRAGVEAERISLAAELPV